MRGWRAVAALNGVIDDAVEAALRRAADLSTVEYVLLDVLRCQHGVHHLRMNQIARATALSKSATTRLVNRMEDRGLLRRYLCADDRRGIYTELTEEGLALVRSADEPYESAIDRAVEDARDVPELAGLVTVLGPWLDVHRRDARRTGASGSAAADG